MTPIRIGIVGLGNAGMMHLKALRGGEIGDAVVTAVACRPARAAATAGLLGAEIPVFADEAALYKSGLCDAVIIATPHPGHPAQVIAALRAGLHVMCEKPAGIRASEARTMAAAAREAGKIYTLNLNRRTVPLYAALRGLMQSGAIGTLRRMSWTSTAWLRVQSYYDSSPWRGTWAGEGGGLLLNQVPHVLDLWQWIFGMPARLHATCGFGRYHDIEVEDEVFVLAEYANGARATLTANTGEAPGVERVEAVGDRGMIVAENGRLEITTFGGSITEFIATSPPGFHAPKYETEVRETGGKGDLVAGITRDFAARIRDGADLLAPGEEGVASLELANAIHLSAWEERWVDLPLDDAHFEKELARRQRQSRCRPVDAPNALDLDRSFSTKTG